MGMEESMTLNSLHAFEVIEILMNCDGNLIEAHRIHQSRTCYVIAVCRCYLAATMSPGDAREMPKRTRVLCCAGPCVHASVADTSVTDATLMSSCVPWCSPVSLLFGMVSLASEPGDDGCRWLHV